MARRTTGIHYGWFVVATTVTTALLIFGVRTSPSILIKPLEDEFGWSRSAISAVIAVGLLCTGLAAPWSGALMDRFGPRRVLAGSLAIVGTSALLASQLQSYWQFLLLWGVTSGLGSGAASVAGASVANRWFVERRGLVQGIMGAGTSAGMLLFLPLLAWTVSHAGWRTANFVMGLLLLSAIPLVLLVMRDLPSDAGVEPYGAPPGYASVAARPPSVRAVMGRATRSGDFWLLAGSFFICGASSNGMIGTHFVPHATDHGIAEVTAAGVLAVMGAMNFVGALTSGWLTDRHDPRKLLAIYYTLRGFSLLALPYLTDVPGLVIFAIVFGLDYIATVPPTVALGADLFGRPNAAMIYGWVFCAHQIGAALAAQVGGLVHDRFGDYTMAFITAGAMALLGGLMALRIERAPVPPALATASVASG